MDRIFMTQLGGVDREHRVNLGVFIKGEKEHLEELIGFLANQNIDCVEFSPKVHDSFPEFGYFNEGFKIRISPYRWTFYELRSFIQSYVDTWGDDVFLKGIKRRDGKICDESIYFDAPFYVDLIRRIDQCEDRYYRESMSISLFLSGILRILRKNLELYWAAARYCDFSGDKLTYWNYSPATLSLQKTINRECAGASSGVIVQKSVKFNGEHLADIFLHPGPFSPSPEIIDKLLSTVIIHIDDFLYGDLNFKRETYKLRCKIAELTEELMRAPTTGSIRPADPERELKTRKRLRLLLLGSTELSEGIILAEFARYGFEKKNLFIETDYSKLGSFDVNNLLAVRSRYDGIILGPMPHKMKGDYNDGTSLIAMMENEPARYPPFVVARDKKEKLKITKSSLRDALEKLSAMIEKVGQFGMAA